MRKLKVITGMAMTLLVSCGGNQNNSIVPGQPSVIPDHKTAEIISWPEPTNCKSNEFIQNEFSEVKFMLLDDDLKSIIGGVDKIIVDDGVITIADYYNAEKVVQFDSLGRFIRQIGYKGKAQGEYLALGSVAKSNTGDLWIADRGARKIIVYSSTGEYLREIPDITVPFSMAIKDSILVGSFPGYFKAMPFRLKWFDSNGKEKDTALPYTSTRSYIAGNIQHTEDGKILYNHIFNDTIYNIGSNSITPLIKMNIVDEKASNDFEKNTIDYDKDSYLKALYGSDKIINNLDFVNCDSNWILKWQVGFNGTLSVISENGKCRRDYKTSLAKTDSGKQGRLLIPDWFVGFGDDWLVGFIDPMAFEYFGPELKDYYLNMIKSNSVKPISDNDEILSSKNLILSFYKFK